MQITVTKSQQQQQQRRRRRRQQQQQQQQPDLTGVVSDLVDRFTSNDLSKSGTTGLMAGVMPAEGQARSVTWDV
jgi:hypothetical protein